jgi:hypothetical protein
VRGVDRLEGAGPAPVHSDILMVGSVGVSALVVPIMSVRQWPFNTVRSVAVRPTQWSGAVFQARDT